MANEVIIEEYAHSGKGIGSMRDVSVPRGLITTQVLDIATRSAAFNESTVLIRIRSKGTGFWYKIGTAGVNAIANTNGDCWLPADQFVDIGINPANTNIDTAADA